MTDTVSILLSYEPHPTDEGATVADVLVKFIQNTPQTLTQMRANVEVIKSIIGAKANNESAVLPADLARQILEMMETQTYPRAHPAYIAAADRLAEALQKTDPK